MHTRQSNRERSYIGKIYLIEMRHIDKNSSQYKPDRSSIFVGSSKQVTAAASDVARTMRLSDLLDGGTAGSVALAMARAVQWVASCGGGESVRWTPTGPVIGNQRNPRPPRPVPR